MSSEKRQIYIVDDDESVRRALKLLMLTYGFSVDAFATSEEFFKAVPNSAPGCLILDIHMPGLDGWATLQRLFLSGSERRVIMISANKSGANKERAFKAGAVGFLQKPFKDQELVDLINQETSKLKEDGMRNNFLLIITGLFLTTTILGCNMLRGAGKDVENAGKSVQKTVDHND